MTLYNLLTAEMAHVDAILNDMPQAISYKKTDKENNIRKTIWYDWWCEAGPMCKYVSKTMIYEASLKDNATVNDMIVNGEWSWPIDWFTRIPQLSNIPSPQIQDKCVDKIIWRNNKGDEGKFTVHGAWLDFRDNIAKMEWYRHIWFTQCLPRHAFITWLALKKGLQTQERLLKWDPTMTDKCSFCNMEVDTVSHLFFKCSYTQKVWEAVRIKAKMEISTFDW